MTTSMGMSIFCACSFHGNFMNNLLSYCGLIDAKIRDSDLFYSTSTDKQKNRCPKLFGRVGWVHVRDSREIILKKTTTLGLEFSLLQYNLN